MANLEAYLSQERGRQARLAKQLGLAAGTLSAIRSGYRRPSPDLARRIEAATDGAVSAAALLGLEEAGAAFGHETRARPLNAGRWSIAVSADGSLHLPAEMVAALGFAPAERLLFTPDGDNRVRLHSTDKALKTIQAELRGHAPEGVSPVDELIAERRAEAARE